ncbi:MAG: putative baseplate assembly protein [Polyangiales bacterium]
MTQHRPEAVCKDDRTRRSQTRATPLHGIDFIELGAAPRELSVYFLGRAPKHVRREALVVEGGRRVRDLKVVDVHIARADDEAHDDRMIVTLDRSGDGARYTLRVAELDAEGRVTADPPADFDPRYDRATFSFAVDCPTQIDCKPATACLAPAPSAPDIDYLAKDYGSFRQLMLDRLALVAPGWQERHVPGLGITLVELIAYVGDQLSYHQDAVATEAYLDTARRRVSVRRHLRLVDYALHEGCNARAWLSLDTSQDRPLRNEDFFVVSAALGDEATVRTYDDWQARRTPGQAVFEPYAPGALVLRVARNTIRFHTWHGDVCCLPRGATCASLVDPGVHPDPPAPEEDDGCEGTSPRKKRKTRAKSPEQTLSDAYQLHLAVGDVLVFEEVRGPKTGLPEDADPAHRHAVRLTHVAPRVDPVRDPQTGKPTLIWDVCWHAEDALPFDLCLDAPGPAPHCVPLRDVSVARGNVLLVDHGETQQGELGRVPVVQSPLSCADDCTPMEVASAPGRFRPRIPADALTHREPPRGPATDLTAPTSATSWFRRTPRHALAQVALDSIPGTPRVAAFEPRDVQAPEVLARALVGALTVPDEAGEASRWLVQRMAPSLQQALRRWGTADGAPALPDELAAKLRAFLQALTLHWTPRADLLDSSAEARAFVVEVDDERAAQVRFGDGTNGALPPAGATFHATFRVGNGVAGNVGAGALNQLVLRTATLSGITLRVRNPMPATGGMAFEPVEAAKRRAPHAFRRELARAVTAADYAEIALRDFRAEVQRAAAVLHVHGQVAEVQVAIDALGCACADDALLARIARHLEAFRRIGHTLRVLPAVQVPVQLGLRVCVSPGYARGQVRTALQRLLSSRVGSDGTPGLFHADNLTFGTGLRVSQIAALAQAVPGVQHLRVTTLKRAFQPARHGASAEEVPASGVLSFGPLEVPRMDGNPEAPEHGALTLHMEGGR